MITAWETIDDPRSLDEALEGIDALAAILEQERAAVATLDATRLAAIADEKAPLIERLRRLAKAPPAARPSSPDGRRIKEQVREAAVQLLAQAEANAALLNDAIHALSAALGVEQEAGTYDAHARMRRRVQAFAGRRA